jgi:hypothetical protein
MRAALTLRMHLESGVRVAFTFDPLRLPFRAQRDGATLEGPGGMAHIRIPAQATAGGDGDR